MFDKMFGGFADKLRAVMIGFSAQGAQRAEAEDVRKLGLSVAGIARRTGALAKAVTGLAETEAFHHAETATWLTPKEIAEGASGPFEACNLLSWLAIADKAGVSSIPARPILHLTDAEAEAASGMVPLPTGAIPERIRARIRQGIKADPAFAALLEQAQATNTPAQPVDPEELSEKLYACMDDVPEGWMVRTTQAGPGSLKALAGTGLVETTAPEVRFGPGLEVGPGWVRNNNRRRVDCQDRRLIKSYIAGPHTGMTYVARPWVQASRYVEGRDPHRAGTPLDIPGKWPAEWRAFVEGGKCSAVASYYGWLETPTPFTARIALEVRDLAQRIVDTAIAQGLEPRYMDVEHARRNPELAGMLEEHGFGPGTFACSLDFMETKDGLLLLEGGPGHTPVGGAHPCAFAGVSGRPTIGNPMKMEGVAFRHMPHVLIGEPKTWEEGDRTGCILGWDEVEALAASENDR